MDAPASLQTGEMALLFDGGKRGNSKPLTKPWSQSTDIEQIADDDEEDSTENRSIYQWMALAIKSHKSVMGRRLGGKSRGPGIVPQSDTMRLIGAGHLVVDLPERSRGIYPGSDKGTIIGDVELLRFRLIRLQLVRTRRGSMVQRIATGLETKMR